MTGSLLGSRGRADAPRSVLPITNQVYLTGALAGLRIPAIVAMVGALAGWRLAQSGQCRRAKFVAQPLPAAEPVDA